MGNGIVVLLSGGMDSTTLLAEAVETFPNVIALSVDYSQRHKRELLSAVDVARHYGVEHRVLDISNINELIGGSALTSKDVKVPHGHYADPNMKVTVVPGRNTILLSIAGGLAVSRGFNTIAYASHLGDHDVYPDCRKVYIDAMREVFKLFDYEPVDLWTPFIGTDKTGILKRGLELKVPYNLTWTCYEGREKSCGHCGSCCERLESFRLNNVTDPLQYE